MSQETSESANTEQIITSNSGKNPDKKYKKSAN